MAQGPTPKSRIVSPADVLSALGGSLSRVLVACDFDGTLAPIVPRPEDARAHPDAPSTLAAIAAVAGTVAVITGRPAATAASIGSLESVPGVVVLGHYGLQRWQDGELSTPPPDPGVAELRESLTQLAAAAGDGVTVEDKGHSVALHTRNAASPQEVLDGLRGSVDDVAARLGLEVVPGRFVLEVRPTGIDKGSALLALAEESGAGAVLFFGDDLGDLPAVTAIEQLRSRGTPGVVVCSDSAETPAELRSRADLLVPGPAGVVALLRSLVELNASR